MKPSSYNPWLYGYANPIRYTDANGQRPCDDFDEYGRCITYKKSCESGLCPTPPLVAGSTDIYQSYKALLNMPCANLNGVFLPWWKSKSAIRKEYAPIDNRMLVAVLVYTEASPIRNDQEALGVFTETAAYRFWQRCNTYGGCEVSGNGTVLQGGLRFFLAWSSTFVNYGINGIGTTTPIVTGQYDDPQWAYKVAGDIVAPKDLKWKNYTKDVPQGVFNTQYSAEEDYFKSKYVQKYDTGIDGVYYKWTNKGDRAFGDWVVLTQNQEEHHCGLNHEKFVCGGSVK